MGRFDSQGLRKANTTSYLGGGFAGDGGLGPSNYRLKTDRSVY